MRQLPGQARVAPRSRGRSLASEYASRAGDSRAVGPTSTSPLGVAGEVHAEERQARVGHRVDQRAHQLAALGAQPQVGAAERHDPRLGRARRPSPPAGPTSRRRRTPRSRRSRLAARVAQREPRRRPPTRPPRRRRWPRSRRARSAARASARATPRKSAMPVFGRVQRGHAGGVRLELAQLVRAQPPQPRHAVLAPAPLELVQARQLGLVARHDHLAAALVGDRRAPRRTRTSRAAPSTHSLAFSEPGV